MGNNLEIQRQRVKLFLRQEGKCYYCQCDMVLMFRIDPKFHADNLCTLEHFDDRFSPERGLHHGEYRRVASCYKCNHEHGVQAQSSIPIEELNRRSRRYAKVEITPTPSTLCAKAWTHGGGTDVKARDPDCSKWEKPE